MDSSMTGTVEDLLDASENHPRSRAISNVEIVKEISFGVSKQATDQGGQANDKNHCRA